MKAKISALLALILIPVALPAKDDPRIERIRMLYREAGGIETAENARIHEVKYNSIVPGIGPQETRLVFVYDSWQDETGRDPSRLLHRLRKVTVRYSVASQAAVGVEYLFDEKERPVFYYTREETGIIRSGKPSKLASERRYYFDNGSLISAVVYTSDWEGGVEKYSSMAPFKQQDIDMGKSALAAAEKYLRFFRHMVEMERVK